MGYSEYYKKEETKMNLGKKYKQLFEGKTRSNDFILLNESVDKYFSIIKGDKLINSKGLSNVEKTGPKELKMTFKSKVNKNWDSLDIINHLYGDDDQKGGLIDKKDFSDVEEVGDNVIMVTFRKSSSTSQSSTGVEVTGHDQIEDDTIEFKGFINDISWTALKEYMRDGAVFTSVYDENDKNMEDYDDDQVAYDSVIDAINQYMEKEGIEDLFLDEE